jgi:hypothetical protein
MIMLIAMLFGMWDAISLTLLGSVNLCMNLFGLLHERMNQGRTKEEVNWEPFIFGCFAGLVPWAAIFAYIIASPDVGRVPGFVWGILGAYLFFFNTFPINSEWPAPCAVRFCLFPHPCVARALRFSLQPLSSPP